MAQLSPFALQEECEERLKKDACRWYEGFSPFPPKLYYR